jgi:hypothetical protein
MEAYTPIEGSTVWTRNGYAAHWEDNGWHFHVPCAVTRFGRLSQISSILVLVGDTHEHAIAWDSGTMDRPMTASLLTAWRVYRAAAISRVTKAEAEKLARYARNFGNRSGGLTVAIAAETAYHRIIWDAFRGDPAIDAAVSITTWRASDHPHVVEQLAEAANELFDAFTLPSWHTVMEESRDLDFAYRSGQRHIQAYKGLTGICAHIGHSLGTAPNGIGRLHGAAANEFRL